MTPKEKAKELVELFWIEVEDNEYPTRKMSLNQAKQCVLIAVDEIKEVVSLCIPYKDEKSYIDYWQQVKHEINNL